ncbi:conserved hypothetical protein [Cupriavidus taiwanensis]|nr:conserved hypothetical protein [Cupriavidus taiwanensis]SOZ71982.1 conserved hypothetical protein [Cupriavidus taiwanensis]SOZ87283.1 conserved hypothetical protein [Cupriavidus taiwanensis]SOZ90319.1 conserved hypothetical protein [Cupriavidus taiwanensis]SOZ94876.1 conserved hypothetical protein [Cupriavidus taiwanensis]
MIERCRMASATWAVRESSGLEGGAPNCPHGQEKHGAADLAAGGEVPGQVKGKARLRGAHAHACRRPGRAVQGGETGGARHGGAGANA